MEKLAHKIAIQIGSEFGYDAERQEVIAYGLIGIFQMAAIFIIISLLGAGLNVLGEAMTIFFAVGILRKSTGGAHASSMWICLIMSCSSILLMSLITRYMLLFMLPVYYYLFFCISVFALCMIVAVEKAPVDSPNKPIVRKDKIKRLRRQSFVTISAYYLAASGILLFMPRHYWGFALALMMSMAWQTMTLTNWGKKGIGWLDSRMLRLN